jgi:hypothetical protein
MTERGNASVAAQLGSRKAGMPSGPVVDFDLIFFKAERT